MKLLQPLVAIGFPYPGPKKTPGFGIAENLPSRINAVYTTHKNIQFPPSFLRQERIVSIVKRRDLSWPT
jgi:hypothetical protein